jgi:hypothetical protein
VQVATFTLRAQQANLVRIGRFCAPHARARREDLESVSAQIGGRYGGLLQTAGGECVNA